MAFLPMAAAALSVGSTVAGGIASGNSASYQAQVARNNAIIAEQNADYATKAGMAKEETSSLKGRAVAGRVKTGLAASGVAVNSGSALDTIVSQREQQKLDTETVKNNAELEAYGYRTQKTNFEAQAQLKQQEADFAPWGAALKAGGTLLEKWPSFGGGGGGGGITGTAAGTTGAGAGGSFSFG